MKENVERIEKATNDWPIDYRTRDLSNGIHSDLDHPIPLVKKIVKTALLLVKSKIPKEKKIKRKDKKKK